MSFIRKREANSHWFTKTLIVMGAGVCLVLGVVGIILPVIPGLLFLALAAILIARVSRRAANYLDEHPGWRRQQRFWKRSQHLAFHERVQLACLLTVRYVVDGLHNLSETLFTRKS